MGELPYSPSRIPGTQVSDIPEKSGLRRFPFLKEFVEWDCRDFSSEAFSKNAFVFVETLDSEVNPRGKTPKGLGFPLTALVFGRDRALGHLQARRAVKEEVETRAEKEGGPVKSSGARPS